jgi:hypothetical protein
MSPNHANKKGVRYRYYVSQALLQNRKSDADAHAAGSRRREDKRCSSAAPGRSHTYPRYSLGVIRRPAIGRHGVTLLNGGISTRVWTLPRLGSCRSNELRSPEFVHPVERFDRDCNLGSATGEDLEDRTFIEEEIGHAKQLRDHRQSHWRASKKRLAMGFKAPIVKVPLRFQRSGGAAQRPRGHLPICRPAALCFSDFHAHGENKISAPNIKQEAY